METNLITQISLNDKHYRTFKRAYLEAVRDKKKQFVLYEQDILTSFAKYLLEAVENDREARGLRLIPIILKEKE